MLTRPKDMLCFARGAALVSKAEAEIGCTKLEPEKKGKFRYYHGTMAFWVEKATNLDRNWKTWLSG